MYIFHQLISLGSLSTPGSMAPMGKDLQGEPPRQCLVPQEVASASPGRPQQISSLMQTTPVDRSYPSFDPLEEDLGIESTLHLWQCARFTKKGGENHSQKHPWCQPQRCVQTTAVRLRLPKLQALPKPLRIWPTQQALKERNPASPTVGDAPCDPALHCTYEIYRCIQASRNHGRRWTKHWITAVGAKHWNFMK